MRDGVRSGRRRLLRRSDEPPANEDFLFHLARGSEMLMHERVVEAKEELERALEFRPRDAQSQDLLAGVYFRLGVYPSAIRLWRNLVADFPSDTTLHVNLGLALLKTGQPAESQEHLERALELDPDHERAWGYLGLVQWRQGKLDTAREAFLRGGQVTMARRMEEQLGDGEREPRAGEPDAGPLELPLGVEAAQVRAMRDAASAAAEKLAGDVQMSVEIARPAKRSSGQWNVLETGAHSVPAPAGGRSEKAARPGGMATLAQTWALHLPDGSELAVGPSGELLIDAKSAVYSRLMGLRTVRGHGTGSDKALQVERMPRRFRARTTEEPLGGTQHPILRWEGPVAGVIAPHTDEVFVAVHVDKTLLYVREELVFAFDDRVGYESGRLPLAGRPAVLLSFHGDGVVVLRVPRAPTGLEVGPGEVVHVDPDALLGWTGRLFPSEAKDPLPASLPLAFKGQGIVLVT